MTKTDNYNLNQWEPHDEIRVEDFNADNAAIDAALGELSTAAARFGNCSVVCSSYTGTGTYGSSNKTTLSFSVKPLAVFVLGSGYNAVMLRSSTTGYAVDTSSFKRNLTVAWGTNSVSWYSDSSSNQMNSNGNTYYYVALLT